MILHGLAADRLEYTLSNGLGATKRLWSLNEIKEIYNDIEVQKNEDGIAEIGFKSLKNAEKFVNVMSELSSMYICSKTKFSMQFLADIIKKMSNRNLIAVEDLYRLSDKEVIKMIEACEYGDIAKCFDIWKNAEKINESDEKIEDKYTVSVNAKIRYIVPLVRQENKFVRINQLSENASESIKKALNYKTKKYSYLDFKF